jgi:hypothetical protein
MCSRSVRCGELCGVDLANEQSRCSLACAPSLLLSTTQSSEWAVCSTTTTSCKVLRTSGLPEPLSWEGKGDPPASASSLLHYCSLCFSSTSEVRITADSSSCHAVAHLPSESTLRSSPRPTSSCGVLLHAAPPPMSDLSARVMVCCMLPYYYNIHPTFPSSHRERDAAQQRRLHSKSSSS